MVANNSEELEWLRRQLKEITAERDRLLSEIRRLHRDYSIKPEELGQISLSLTGTSPASLPAATEPATGSMAVNNESPLHDKLRLFRSLFHGWEDVFARLPLFLEAVYNKKRLHSTLSYHTPEEFEELLTIQQNNEIPRQTLLNLPVQS